MKCVVPVSFRSKSSGFTLIELMIAVAIVGVLAAIAYPSYIEYVKKGRRAEVMVQMLAARQLMERYYTENRSYPSAPYFNNNFQTNVPPGASDAERNYVLWLDPAKLSGGSAFWMSASRDGAMLRDKCGNPNLDNFGRKGVLLHNFGSDKEALEYCWP